MLQVELLQCLLENKRDFLSIIL